VFGHGFYVQGSYIFKPANVEVYASTSYVFGDQSAGYGTSDERIVGVNFFPFRTGGGFEDRTFFNLNFQPVMPITVTPGVNLIARTIVPVVSIHGPEGMRFSGVADIQQQLFFTPSSPGKLIWGVGPAFSIADDPRAVAVFFITGRPPELRDATERNLRQEGYRPAGVILLPEGKTFESAADFKAPERRKLAEQGYTIIVNMGDQESDLRGGYAEKTFKLPNPVYFLP
jgi:hypothetical protein